MIRVWLTVLLAVGLAGCAYRIPDGYGTDWLAGPYIGRAISDGERIWLLRDGQVFHLDLNNIERLVPMLESGRVADLCLSAGVPVVAVQTARADWMLRRWAQGRWQTIATIDSRGDGLRALICDEQATIRVLTDRRLMTVDGDKVAAVPLRFAASKILPRLRRFLTTNPYEKQRDDQLAFSGGEVVAIGFGGKIYAGLDHGEWGGGVLEIDPLTGAVVVRERTGEDLCEGPLSTHCDPVLALAPLTYRPGCVVAAVGSLHLSASGRLVEICGTRIESMFAASSARPAEAYTGNERYETVPFLGVVAVGSDLIAAGPDYLYRFKDGALSEVTPLNLQTAGNIRLDATHEEVIVLMRATKDMDGRSSPDLFLIPR